MPNLGVDMAEQLPPIVIARRDHARLERLADGALRERHPVGRFLMSGDPSGCRVRHQQDT